MIRVKFLKSHPAYGYFAGDTGVVSGDASEKLLKGGYIIPLPDAEDMIVGGGPPGTSEGGIANSAKPAKVNGLPADLPGRAKLFENGLDTVEKIGEAGDDGLLELGLSKGTVTKIRKYLKA